MKTCTEVEISDYPPVRVRMTWNGENMFCQLNQKAPPPVAWLPVWWQRYRAALDDFLGEVAKELTLVQMTPTGPVPIPTSLEHRTAVAREWWLRDTA